MAYHFAATGTDSHNLVIDDSLKIGLCLSSAPGYSETFIRSKIKGLLRAGFDVQVFVFTRAPKEDDIRYRQTFTIKAPWVYLYFPAVVLYVMLRRPARVKRFFKLQRNDNQTIGQIFKSLYINAHVLLYEKLDWLHFVFATIAVGRENLAAAMNAKLAVSLRGFDIGLYPLTHPGCYTTLWKRVQKIHTISDDLLHVAVAQGLPPDTLVNKIRPAIEITNLQPKKKPGYVQTPVRILSVGRLEWKKGFVYALQAMHVLKQKGVKLTYSIVGSGSLRQELLYTVRDLKLEDSVFLLGELPHTEIFKILNESDVYIQPSVQEGFCNALVEAQGTGLLCVASDAEGLSENIKNEETGWIVPKRDPMAIANKVTEILAMDVEKRKAITQAAIARVASEFRMERLVKEFEAFYATV